MPAQSHRPKFGRWVWFTRPCCHQTRWHQVPHDNQENDPVTTTDTSRAAAPTGTPVLSVRKLDIDFWVNGIWYPAVKDADFDLFPGEVLAIVGESGSGKSTSAMAIMGLLPRNANVEGSIKLGDRELVGAPERIIRQIRGKEIAVIFQEPMTALNPVYTI